MTRWRAARFVAAAVLAAASRANGQDTTTTPPPVPTVHVLALDTARVRPYTRVFEMVVQRGDSTHVLGERTVSLGPASYAGGSAWLLIETRTGVVPAVDSLYLRPDLRPLHWSSVLGLARMGFEFSGDSIFGAVTAPGSRRSIVLAGRADLVTSSAMIEALLPLLPLSAEWMDSIGVMSVDLARTTISSATLAVIGDEEMAADSTPPRPTWVVALRFETRNVLFWVDKESGEVRRMQQPLPAPPGALLEFRLNPQGAGAGPPPGSR